MRSRHVRSSRRLIGVLVLACAILAPALYGGGRSPLLGIAHAQAALQVTSVADSAAGSCAAQSSTCTLRSAIQEANARPGADRIEFAIPGAGPHTIQLSSSLPALSDPSGGTTIDGYTQPGAEDNSVPEASNARIMIQIRGQGAGQINGVTINGIQMRSAGNVLRGVALFNFHRAVTVRGGDAKGNVVAGCFIGMDAAGNTPYTEGQVGIGTEGATGVRIDQGATGTLIGGSAVADRNVISGNAREGIYLNDAGTNGTQIANNIIGLDPSGTQRRRNWGDGIDINFGVQSTTIGGSDASGRNIISGNQGEGVEISHINDAAITSGNVVQNNFIGSDLFGRGSNPAVTQNRGFGVALEDGVSDNTIGPGNVIVGNGKGGVFVSGSVGPTPLSVRAAAAATPATGNRITRNRIGVDLDGAWAGNGFNGTDPGYGIWLADDTQRSTIELNIVANSFADGMRIEGADTDFNKVTQNSFYANGGLAIDIGPSGANTTQQCAGPSSPQQCVALPVLRELTPSAVSGQACPGCAVEVFIADDSLDNNGEGKTFIGAATADAGGRFSLPIPVEHSGRRLTATATDSQGNTSEFAQNVGKWRLFLPLARRAS